MFDNSTHKTIKQHTINLFLFILFKKKYKNKQFSFLFYLSYDFLGIPNIFKNICFYFIENKQKHIKNVTFI